MHNDEYKQYKLKPCPFCGGEARVKDKVMNMPGFFYVECSVCFASVDVEREVETAVNNWNRRVGKAE